MENHTPPPPPRTLKIIIDGTLPFDNIAHDLFTPAICGTLRK